MKIGKSTTPHTAISASTTDTIVVRGRDLTGELIGRTSFTAYFHLLVTGRDASAVELAVLDATLVAIAEHGFVPSVQAARMTYAAAPDALQGAVAAGLLGCGSVILGAAEAAGRLLHEVVTAAAASDLESAAEAAVRARVDLRQPIPGYGHPLHKMRDPRVDALFDVARRAGADQTYIEVAQCIEGLLPRMVGKSLMLNVSAAIPAVLLGIGFPLAGLKGVPLLARTAGLIAHLVEESETPSGFALSYQAAREAVYDGTWPQTSKTGAGHDEKEDSHEAA